MSTVHVIDHPLVISKLTKMRDKNTHSHEFRELLNQIASLMAYEVTRDFPLEGTRINTPICEGEFLTLANKNILLAPILRAGVGLVDGMLNVLPFAHVGYIGMYRDEETLQPVEYLCKLPDNLDNMITIVLDPMLATGGSAVDAIQTLKDHGLADIRMMNLVAAPEGIAKVQEMHPDVDIYVAAIDQGLNDKAYIVPGLGDAGDRIFYT